MKKKSNNVSLKAIRQLNLIYAWRHSLSEDKRSVASPERKSHSYAMAGKDKWSTALSIRKTSEARSFTYEAPLFSFAQEDEKSNLNCQEINQRLSLQTQYEQQC